MSFSGLLVNFASSALFYILVLWSKLFTLLKNQYVRLCLSVFVAPLCAWLLINHILSFKNTVVLEDVGFDRSLEDFFSIQDATPIRGYNSENEDGSQSFGFSTSVTVAPGQSLASILKSLDISDSQVSKLLSDPEIRKLPLLPNNQVKVEYECDVKYTKETDLEGYDSVEFSRQYNLPLRHSFKKSCKLTDLKILQKDKIIDCKIGGENNASVHVKKLSAKKVYRVVSGKIITSLYADSVSAGVAPSIVMQAINQYSFILDLQRDIREGDYYVFVFEEIMGLDGKKIGNGNLLFANLILGTKSNEIYLFNSGYYTWNGESIKKALLKTPVDGARITSGFGTRKHPILGYTKKHQGVDFGAPTGTPIYAAGDGVVEYSGVNGGYGKFISIRHNKELKTNYAHLSRISPVVRRGARVFQKQIIGYVGSTGMSTGPHLHFEVEIRGQKVNPKSTYFNPGKKLNDSDLVQFKEQKRKLEQMISGNV